MKPSLNKSLAIPSAWALTAALVTAGAALLPLAPAVAAVTIDPPSSATAGTVVLSGTTATEPGETTSVLFVLDSTRSTGQVAGLDCSGDGVAGSPGDDLNGDGANGDILDCEIAGVQALSGSLGANTGLQVGLVAFADRAAAANLDPNGSATFVPPAFTGGDARTRIDTVASSVTRDRIGLYDVQELGDSGSGTAFTGAVTTALATLAAAPAGPKWVMFLSDGLSGIDDSALADLSASGVRLRSFAVGSAANCGPSGSLAKMARATGETCEEVAQPAGLAAQLRGSQPDAVGDVSVTIGNVSAAATLDAVGGWRAGFTLGAGTYTAKVRATLASGAVSTAQRTFVVTAGSATSEPARGSVALAPGSLRATTIKVARPAPSRSALPSLVSGRVGRPVGRLVPTRTLAGSTVMLQARSEAGSDWVTVASDRVSRSGAFDLRWKPRLSLPLLRVALAPSGAFAGSIAAVPAAKISACKVARRGSSAWRVTCRTTEKSGSVVRLLDGRSVSDRTTVRNGAFRLRGTGPVRGTRIELAVGASRRVTLTL